MIPPKRLDEGTWREISSSEVSISDVTGGTCTFNDGVRLGNLVIIRFTVKPSSVSQVSSVGMNVGQVDAVVTLNGKNFFKCIGLGSNGNFSITTYISTNHAFRTRTFGLAANAEIVQTVFAALP